LSLQAVREIWSFSQWMLTINIGNYANDKGDEFVVGKLGAPREMGLYTVAYEISNLPLTELLYPISRALFPGYAKLVEEPKRLAQAYLNVLGFISTFSVAAGFGIAVVANDLTTVILGSRWQDAVPLIRWLAFFGVLRAIYGQAASVLLSLGHTRVLAIITWLQLLLLIPSTVVAGIGFGIIGIAVAKLCVASVFAGLLFQSLIRKTSITVTDLARQIWRPCAAGIVMVLAVSVLPQLTTAMPLVSLIRDATCGAAVYLSVLVVLWVASGRPAGTEQFVVQLMADRNRRLGLLRSQ
jgi:O-antigen/teichoic acid export membrane protein